MNIVIDLDGTLAEWDGGDEKVCGRWIEGRDGGPGAREALALLLTSGHRCVVQTCRATWPAGGGAEAVEEFLRSGGFEPVRVVGRWPIPVSIFGGPEARYADGLTPRVFAECPAGCANGMAGGGVECPECRGHGVRVEPFEVGIWMGVGKPIAHWYVDDRAIPFDSELAGWGRALEMLELVGVELNRPVAA